VRRSINLFVTAADEVVISSGIDSTIDHSNENCRNKGTQNCWESLRSCEVSGVISMRHKNEMKSIIAK
jgi:hypothetical protein